jgi:hypothetical protein
MLSLLVLSLHLNGIIAKNYGEMASPAISAQQAEEEEKQ